MSFNIKNFLTQEFKNLRKIIFSFLRHQKPIAGLAITEDSLDVIIFDEHRNRKLGEKINIDISSAESVKNGLKNLKKKFGPSFSSVVVSFPPSFLYLAMFEFPIYADDEQIKEAMKLAASSLPLPEESIYFDWMPLKNNNVNKKEVVLAAAKRDLIDNQLKIFEENKLSIIAAETFAWSVGRFLEEGDKITMVIMKQPKNIFFILYDGSAPYFQFNLPKDRFNSDEEFLAASVRCIKNLSHFAATDNGGIRTVEKIVALAGDKIIEYWQKALSGGKAGVKVAGDEQLQKIKIQQGFNLENGINSNDLAFLAALGALKRGLIPRKNDEIVSILPINTTTAYEQHRLFSFVDFFQKFSIGFAGFLIVIFLGNLIMLKMLFPGIEEELKKEGSFSSDLSAIIEKEGIFNENIGKLSKINQTTPQWENVFSEIDKIVASSATASGGLILNQISVSGDGNVSFSGVAATRGSLIKLKDNLGSSEIFSSDPLPLSIFLNKGSIPFAIKAKLKDAKILIPNE